MTERGRPQTTTRQTPLTRTDLGAILILTALAAALRAPGLAPDSLWIDDAWVAYAHRASWAEITEIGLSAPGFSASLKVLFSIVGFGEVRAQLLPFAAGIAAPALVFWVLRHRVRTGVGLAAAGWMLLVPVHVEYSTRVKQYTIEVVLALLIVHFAWRVLEEPTDNRRWRPLAIVSTIAVLVSFPLASIAGSACAVTALVHLWRHRRISPSLVWLAVPAVTTVTWFTIVIRHRQYGSLRRFWEAFYIQTDAGVLVSVESLLGRVKDLFEQVSPLPATASVVLVAIAVLAAARRRPTHVAITTLPLATAVVLAVLERAPLGGGRTDLYLLAGLILTTAIGVEEALLRADTSVPMRYARPAIGVGVAGALALGAWQFEQPAYPREAISSLVDELAMRREPSDAVLVYHNAKWAFATYSDLDVEVHPTSGPYDVVFPDPQVVRQRFPFDDERLLRSVNEASELGNRVWLIGSHFSSTWNATVAAMEGTGRTVVITLERSGARLLLFE